MLLEQNGKMWPVVLETRKRTAAVPGMWPKCLDVTCTWSDQRTCTERADTPGLLLGFWGSLICQIFCEAFSSLYQGWLTKHEEFDGKEAVLECLLFLYKLFVATLEDGWLNTKSVKVGSGQQLNAWVSALFFPKLFAVINSIASPMCALL